MTNEDIDISVVVTTYNHENLIRDCIRGILAQSVPANVEIIIGDDCSTDNNQKVIKEEISKNTDPTKEFKLLFHPQNLSAFPAHPGKLNFLKCISSASGKYIALCEGDDYWTDPHKLQKQRKFLDENPSYTIAAHGTNVMVDGQLIYKKFETIDYELKDFVKDHKVGSGTCSLFFRNSTMLQELIRSKVYENTIGGDWLLCIICLKLGKMRKFGESMAVYRVHPKGVYSQKPKLDKFKMHVTTALAINQLTSFKYNRVITNFNVRKLFLSASDFPKEFPQEEIISEYKKIDSSALRKRVTIFMLKSSFSLFFMRYLSKLLFFKMKI